MRNKTSTATLGRELPVATVSDFSTSATCYAELNGRDLPRAGILDLYEN